MKYKFLLMMIFGCFDALLGQPAFDPARSPYMEAGSSAPTFSTAFSRLRNPASLSYLKGFDAGLYTEKKYMLQGIAFAAVAAAYGRHGSGAGIQLNYFGNAAFHETHGSFAMSKNLGRLQVGAAVNYSAYAVRGVRKTSAISLGIHSIWNLTDKLYTSVQLTNPPFARFRSQATIDAAEYIFSFGYELAPDVALSIAFDKVENVPVQLMSVLQFRFGNKYYAKAGITTAGPQPFVGLGWQNKLFGIEASVSYHPVLGLTPGTMFMYEKRESAR